jgi:hypothetical protein
MGVIQIISLRDSTECDLGQPLHHTRVSPKRNRLIYEIVRVSTAIFRDASRVGKALHTINVLIIQVLIPPP